MPLLVRKKEREDVYCELRTTVCTLDRLVANVFRRKEISREKHVRLHVAGLEKSVFTQQSSINRMASAFLRLEWPHDLKFDEERRENHQRNCLQQRV